MKYIYFIVLIFFIVGCESTNKDVTYNKTAQYWFDKMVDDIASIRLDMADNAYMSLDLEYKRSSLTKRALLILALAHIDADEFDLANYYLEEYEKKYKLSSDIDYIKYLKIRLKAKVFKKIYRNQDLVRESLVDIDNFIEKYPNSIYLYSVKNIKSRLLMANAKLNLEIASLYKRLDKKDAVLIYEQKAKTSWKDVKHIQNIELPWYRKLVE